MATKELSLGVSARVLAAASVVAVVFGIVSVLFGDAALATAGVLAVIGGVVALLLSVGEYLRD